MASPEEIAAMFEAIEDVDDDRLVLSTLHAMRDEAFRRDLRLLVAATPATRRTLRGVLARQPARAPANSA